MKYDDEYHTVTGHINLFETTQTEPKIKTKSILKHSSSYSRFQFNYKSSNQNDIDSNQTVSNNNEKSNVELSIRGYGSNLYRDDANALKIEDKTNLIPWNGDSNLLIDRYDCRLYLYDLDPYDSELLTQEQKNPKYTQEEIEIEDLCDLDRYLDLVEEEEQNDDENSTNHLNSSNTYGAVGHVYDNSNNSNKNEDSNQAEPKPAQERLFIPDDNLKLPIGMLIPETVKMNQLIVKTASFVAKQGLQAEILLKTKQSNNSQFNFLSHENNLNSYYKHLIVLIRENKIDPSVYLNEPTHEVQNEPESNSINESDDEDEDGYLHPLLSKAIGFTCHEEKETEVKQVESELSLEQNKQEPVNEPEELKEKSVEKSDSESVESTIKEPSGNIKVMIDKMAEYVCRNGIEFETNLKNKNDSRFDFLNDENEFNSYYRLQIKNISKDIEQEKDERSKSRSSRSKSHKKSHKASHRRSDDESELSHKSESDASDTSSDERKRSKEKKKSKRKSRHKESSRHNESSRKKHRRKSSDRH